MPELSHWNGDEYRWHRWSKPATSPQSISVIEPATKKPPPSNARTVPFGFSRALPVERDPVTWDGDNA